MQAFIVGDDTSYMLFCFFKRFAMVVIRVKSNSNYEQLGIWLYMQFFIPHMTIALIPLLEPRGDEGTPSVSAATTIGI